MKRRAILWTAVAVVFYLSVFVSFKVTAQDTVTTDIRNGPYLGPYLDFTSKTIDLKTYPITYLDPCDPIRSELDALKKRLEGIRKYDPDQPGDTGDTGDKPRFKPGRDSRVSDEWNEVNALVSETRFALRKCEGPGPRSPPPTAVPLTLTLTNFKCLDQSDEFRVFFGVNTEDDEPYAVVFAVDLKTNLAVSIPVGATNSKMTLVGPLKDVDVDEEYSAPANVIWGLSDVPDMVTSADNLIVLVAMMENDSGSPDQVRTLLQFAAREALVTNLPAFTSSQISRQELVNRTIAEMAGTMGGAKVGVPDPDDNIGPIQELRFFQYQLDEIYESRGPREQSLTFEGDDTKYVLKFRMFR